MIRLLPFITASFFLGSEGSAIMTPGRLGFMVVVIFSLIFLLRSSTFSFKRKSGCRLVFCIYIALLLFLSFFFYFLRISVVSHLGLLFPGILTGCIGACAFSGSGGEVIPHGGASNSSGWTNFDLGVLEESMPETESRGGTPSTNAGPSEPSVNQAPESPSGERERDPSVEQPVLPHHPVAVLEEEQQILPHHPVAVLEEEQQILPHHPVAVLEEEQQLQELQARLHALIRDQYWHFLERGYPRWRQSNPEIYAGMTDLIITSLEIEPTVSDHQLWLDELINDPTKLNKLFQDFK